MTHQVTFTQRSLKTIYKAKWKAKYFDAFGNCTYFNTLYLFKIHID